MLFTQHWYWYPMLNFINLALTPTAIIGINDKLKVPKSFKSISNVKPSFYKYPEMIKIDEKKREKVTVAVLSTTTKAKARKDRKDGKVPGEEPTIPVADKEMTNEEGEEKKEEDKKEEEPEADFQELKNPSRVLK